MRKYPGFALVQAALVTAAMTACCGGGSKCKSDSSSTAGTVADVSSVLVVVDVQRDFFSPEGSLYVSGSEELPAKIAEAAGNYDAVIFTLDWHPGNHCSFASEGGQWPSHCVAFTQGAGLADEFAPVLAKGDGKVFIFKKGQEQDKEQYGAFEGGLEGTVKSWFESADKVDVCGIAGDYCVKETAANILKYVPSSKVTILTDLVRSIDGGAALAQFIKDNSLNEQ